ncbi:hypothetical protein EDC01DRAFT_779361 [Geopyxis carbonaria]|nr:hypothetical protein EDC01DRAFT_779361 [Geopyxis carbonaria]
MADPEVATADPEADAVAREFIDYTEYLPSDIARYLKRIRELGTTYATAYDELDAQLREFARHDSRQAVNGTRVTNGFNHNVVAAVSDKEMELRFRISKCLNTTVKGRKEVGEERERFKEHISRHQARASAIIDKLKEVEIPSRDPTPEKKVQRHPDGDTRMRITLRLNNADSVPSPSVNRRRRGSMSTPAMSRKPPATSLVSLAESPQEGWEDIPETPYSTDKPKKKRFSSSVKRGPKPPPTDPLLSGGAPARKDDGSLVPNHELPWNQLSNEELARLRKRMKKNSGWTPSVTMIVRELETLGRGPNNKEDFRHQWEGKDEGVIGPDDGGIGDPGKILPDDGAGARENKGMRLNRAKKRKREEEKMERAREAERLGLDPEEEERKAEAEEAERHRQIQQQKRRKKKEEDAEAAAKERAEREAIEKAEREQEALEKRLREEAEAAAVAKAKAEAEAAAAKKEKERQEKERLEQERLEKERLAKEKKAKEKAEKAAKAEAEKAEKAAAAAAAALAKALEEEAAAAAAAAKAKAEADELAAAQAAIIAAAASPKKTRSAATKAAAQAAAAMDEDDSDVLSSPPASPPSPEPRRPSRLSSAKPRPPPLIPRAASLAPQIPIRPKRGSVATSTPPPPQTPATTTTRKRSSSAASTRQPAAKKPKRSGGTAAGPSARKRGQPGGRKAKGPAGAAGEEEEEDLNKYCLCNEVSEGTMVACENDDCPKVWFHIDCVGLKKEEAEMPDLKWYCPICKDDTRRKRNRVKKAA